MDLGVSDMARPSVDNAQHGIVLYADCSDYEGVGSMMEVVYLLLTVCFLTFWWIIEGEDE